MQTCMCFFCLLVKNLHESTKTCAYGVLLYLDFHGEHKIGFMYALFI